ncbi:MAG: ABC transporter substrate-binding protein [Paludibacteraceae bacterium]|nr:ABC transporter substrate-binding protein [Paludibacteraceae bacterium]
MKRILLYGLLLVALSVQAQELLPWPTDTIDGKVYYKYTVEKSIGLYRISKNFGVSQEAILQANPELRTRGLRYEEVILIPTNLPDAAKQAERKQPKVVPVKEEVKAEPVKEVKELTAVKEQKEAQPAEEQPDTLHLARRNAVLALTEKLIASVTDSLQAEAEEEVLIDTVRLAILLPLQANTAQRNPTIDRFFDFYAGALLALKHHNPDYVDSIGEKHTTYYDVHTYDVGKNDDAVYQLTDSGALADLDAIIGPAYQKPVEVMSVYALENKIPVVIPFLSMVPEVQSNPYLLKFNPSYEVQTHALMEHLDSLRETTNIVLVDAYANKQDYSQGIRVLRDSIRSRQLPVTHTTIRQILADSVSLALKDSVENILLFHSERYSNVQLLMPYLLSGRHGKPLTILSQYAWQNEHILLPQIFTGVFRSPDSEAAARYEKDFEQYFGHKLSSTLPRYDLLGYDLTSYVLEALRTGTFEAKESAFEGLQSTIQFDKIDNGGYENTHIVIQRR